MAGPVLRAYIVLKLLTGLRRSDLLKIRESDLHDDGIHVRTSKTGVNLVIAWTTELRDAVRTAKTSRPKETSDWLFCTRSGDCYVRHNGTANGFDSLWQRFMRRVIEVTRVTERFQEKDLRKKTASDMSLAKAQALLGHRSAETTQRHYRLKGDVVTPASFKIS